MSEATKKDAFRIGYLTKVAQLGYTPEEFLSLVKQSRSDWSETGKNFADTLGSLAGLAWSTGLLGVGAPAILGLGTGWLHGQLAAPTKEDMEAVKTQQLLREYRAHTARLLNKAMQRAALKKGRK